jgi:hypothetical protein
MQVFVLIIFKNVLTICFDSHFDYFIMRPQIQARPPARFDNF